MNLEVVAKKMAAMAKKIKASNGPLELLGLFLRDDSPDLWDVVVAAPWLKADERASFEYVAGRLRDTLAEDEQVGLSRIVILEHDGAVLRHFLERFKSHTGLADVYFSTDGGAIIRRVYIIVVRSVSDRSPRRTTKKPRRPKVG